MLGPNCETAALEAIRAYPQGLQVGGTTSIPCYINLTCGGITANYSTSSSLRSDCFYNDDPSGATE